LANRHCFSASKTEFPIAWQGACTILISSGTPDGFIVNCATTTPEALERNASAG
jgi:hypothetical protein